MAKSNDNRAQRKNQNASQGNSSGKNKSNDRPRDAEGRFTSKSASK